MSYDGFGAGKSLRATFGTAFNVPMTLVCWIRSTATGWDDTLDHIIHLNDDTTDEADSYGIKRSSSAETLWAPTVPTSGGGNSAVKAVGTTGEYDDVWVTLIATFASTTDRKLYIEDSTSPGTASDEKVTVAVKEVIIGNGWDSLQAALANSQIAEIAIFDKALGTSEIDALQTGSGTGPAPNTVASADCVAYWPLAVDQTTHTDQSGNGGPDLTENGAVTFNAAHPTITSGISIPVAMHHYQHHLGQ